MKKIILAFTIGLVMISYAEAGRGRKPCSGAKDGISHCTASGQFVCNDGSLSRSQKICSGYGAVSDSVDQSSVKKSSAVKNKRRTNRSETSQNGEMMKESPTLNQQKKPTCAPLYMANKPGYTTLPICSDN
ncbi:MULTISPECIES: hypothetical protein [Leclercia]|uniref:hypothetical protein n=1 Tax=Leclercia TaxID=83654 RepID=UPI0032196FE4